MRELMVIDERVVFEKNFRVYGDFENPLFLARDVAEWIEHSNVTIMLNGIDNTEKIVIKIPSNNSLVGLQSNTEYTFLTEDGLYEVLMLSRKPIAKEWKKKVKEILKEIRKTGSYSKPLTLSEQLYLQAQINLENEKKLNEIQQDINRLENNIRRTITSNQFTIIGYANMKGIKPNEYNSSTIGRKATKISKERNLQIGKVVDSKYGLINTYNEEILDEIFIHLD